MDIEYKAEDLAFRDEVRDFIRSHLPDDIRARAYLCEKPPKADVVAWQRILNRKGWAAYSWPKEHGGPGWTAVQRMIFLEENALAGAPELLNFNISMLGPVLIKFGTGVQRKRYLARAANLDDWWCQGFSEPGAGSDLAALRTTARRDNDRYIVSGQKIWTSTAHEADKMMLLVRTDPRAEKPQRGLSFLLLDDVRAPGVTVRPIRTIDGAHHLNEVFFDEIQIPAENLVHEEHRGWEVAKFLLSHERAGIARVGASRARLAAALRHAGEMGLPGGALKRNGAFCMRAARLAIELKALEVTQQRVAAAADKIADAAPDPLSSLLKIKGSELLQLTSELLMDVAGAAALRASDGERWSSKAAATYLYLRSASIYGGSNEIQKNILAKNILGL